MAPRSSGLHSLAKVVSTSSLTITEVILAVDFMVEEGLHFAFK